MFSSYPQEWSRGQVERVVDRSPLMFSKINGPPPKERPRMVYEAVALDTYGQRRNVSMYLVAVAVTVAEAVELPDSVI